MTEIGLPLEELVRRGAREIIQRVIEVEVQLRLEQYADVHLPEREILTAVGPVTVQVPKVRDRSGSGSAARFAEDGRAYRLASPTLRLSRASQPGPLQGRLRVWRPWSAARWRCPKPSAARASLALLS
jgi:hypothetical protein